ncbi:hypothetical protein GGR53DRAFT_532036 [Hypoxylon sp. FL1150]|nr:hypothetical protein GGR53DRAFT_532036 [Hypoxylon sp. FL1150]
MHTPSSVAALLPSTLLPLLLLLSPRVLAASSAADRSICIRGGAENLAAAAACGHKGALRYCLEHAPSYVEVGDIERCFYSSGCTAAEAAIEAAYALHNCDSDKSLAELRRRGPEPVAEETPRETRHHTTTTTATTPKTHTTTTRNTASIQCSTETTIDTSSCPIQSTGTASGRTITCYPSTATTSVCAAENICQTDSAGLNVCMLRSDSLDTGEIIVTIILGACFATGFATLIFLCCRDKAATRKLRARAEAAAIAKASAADATNASVGAGAPAIGTSPVGGGYDPPRRAPSSNAGGGNNAAQNPFDDGPRF